jgi:PTS system nitrogen regulatory IIA component
MDGPGTGSTLMKITDFLSPANVIVETRHLDKPGLLAELCERAARELGLESRPILGAILARENLGSTGVGGGIAIPHARLPWLTRRFGLLVRLKRPIEFEAIDGRPVDIVFLLLSPDKPEDEPLGALACAARTMRDAGTLARIRRARTGAELYAAIAADGDGTQAARTAV